MYMFTCSVGWGKDFRNEGFGDRGGVKYQLVNLISSVQTLLRGEFMPVSRNLCQEEVVHLQAVTSTIDYLIVAQHQQLKQCWWTYSGLSDGSFCIHCQYILY